MMTEGKRTLTNISRYLAVYAIWMVFTVSQLGFGIWVHQLLISAAVVYALKVKNLWLPRAVDMWSMVVIGVMLLITVFVTEAYLSKGMRKQLFWKRVGIVALVEGVVALVLMGLELVV